MATNNSGNQNYSNNADGFSLKGGTAPRTLTVTGSDVTVTGSGANTYTFPTASATLAGLAIAQTWPVLQTFQAGINLGGANIVTDTVTGTMIGTGTSQKIGFFGTNPVVQQAATSDIGGILGNFGLRSPGSNYTINTSGLVQVGAGGLASSPSSRTGTSTTLSTTSAYLNIMNPTAAATVTLPQTATSGQLFYLINVSAFAVTISVATSGTINGASSYTLTASGFKWVELFYSGTSGVWYVKGNN